MTRDYVIGLDGGMPWHYREDMKRFKQRTMGCIVIMGRLTWESIGGRALPGRRNIVISRSAVREVEHYDSVERAMAVSSGRDLWIIGGGQIYGAAMPYLNLLDITYVPDTVEDPNAVCFPPIDSNAWTAVAQSQLAGDANLSNVIYHRVDADD